MKVSRLQFFAVLGALILLLPFATARAATFGRTTVGTLASNGLTADYKRGAKFTLTENGSVGLLCAYLDGQGGASGQQQIRLALYSDASSVPGTKLYESAPFTISSGAAALWLCQNMDQVPLPPGNYWIVIHSGGTAGVVRDYYDGAANWYGNADAFSDGPSSQFGAGTAGTGTMSAYAFYSSYSEITPAGRTSQGTLPSNGLTANYKRASAFTLANQGRLYTASAYVDGKGGAVGAQTLRLAIYKDANGVPGALVTESGEIIVNSGDEAHWRKAYLPQHVLDPGRYWIALHSGGTAGVIRDFGDGPNNFYANADTYSDGATSPFGSGSAGTGTLSAFVFLQPGQYVTRTTGHTEIGPTPSAGLVANRQRGSFAYVVEGDAVVTALYAYLDGNGGASGTQQLRMNVYDANVAGNPTFLEATSEVVTIQAGQAPGWVKFPIKNPSTLFSFNGLFLTIQSGDTAGVARDYGGGPDDNWVGFADNFADGAVQSPAGWSFGTGTLSVKIDYSTAQ